MGAVQLIDIHGAKGGSGKPKTPTEAPDSLRSVAIAKMLIAIGEGEFAGVPTAKDIFLDNTPLADAHVCVTAAPRPRRWVQTFDQATQNLAVVIRGQRYQKP